MVQCKLLQKAIDLLQLWIHFFSFFSIIIVFFFLFCFLFFLSFFFLFSFLNFFSFSVHFLIFFKYQFLSSKMVLEMLKCITCSLCPLNQSMLFAPWTFHQTMGPSLGTESPSLCLSPTTSPAGGRSLVSAPSYISLSWSRCTDLKSLGSFISSSLTSPPAQA